MTAQLLAFGDAFERVPMGLHINGKPSYADWCAFGFTLWRERTSIQWAVGDWLCYGDLRGDWGETYTQAIEVTQYAIQTLMNFAFVSSRIEILRRREELSWSHHEVVAGLRPDEQDRFLEMAIKLKMGRDDLREAVKRFKAEIVSSNSSSQTNPALGEHSDEEVELQAPIASARVATKKLRGIEELSEQLADFDDAEMVTINIYKELLP